MKSRVVKYLVLASALTFMNCGDDAAESLTNAIESGIQSDSTTTGVDNPLNPADPTATSSSAVVDPTSTGSTDPMSPVKLDVTSSATVDPASSSIDGNCIAGSVTPCDTLQPTSSAVVDPSSSASVEPASSSVAANPASSASEPVVVSSSSEQKVESSSSEIPKGIFLAPGTEEEKNQLEVEYKQGINYGSNGNGILAYPKQLSTTQKHGIVIWGPGGGTEPGAYEGMIRRLASHGFVVFALNESPGSGDNAKKALDFLAKKNETQDDELFGKLDMNVAGCSGHSMGGLESEQAVIKDSRVQTAFLNNSGDLGHAAAASVSTSKSIAILYGEGGMERPNAVADYRNNGVKAPACLIKMQGGQGNECASDDWDRTTECGWGHGSGSWGGMAATVAWMRWHLGGEDFRKADFVGTSGKYVNGNIINERGTWKTECKNF